MASEDDSNRKCFTFIWKLENASYCWHRYYNKENIESPSFTVDDIGETNWILRLYPSIDRDNVGFELQRLADNKCVEWIDFELSFLSSDGSVLHALETKNSEFRERGVKGYFDFVSRNDVFMVRRSVFLPQDTLTARCRIWKVSGEMSKNVQCFARTRIAVQKRSFPWDIENFSSIKKDKKVSYEIKSHGNNKSLISLNFLVTSGLVFDETVRFKITPNYQNIKICTFKLSILDSSKNAVQRFQDEFWYSDHCASKDFILFSTKSELLEKRSTYLLNDILSLHCECAFSCGVMLEEIETTQFHTDLIEIKNSDHLNLDKENELSVLNSILRNNMKLMLNDGILSDVKLKTSNRAYPAHKCILSVWSPVFKSMFSSDMKENIKDCVDIEDLTDDTVLHMLRYIYSAEVDEMEWDKATELYEAADKYQIVSLKDICSAFLKSKLCTGNACEALVVADLHQDEDLKGFVQDFILKHGKDVISSKEWEQLMGTNLKLAAETMCLKFKEELK